MFNITNAKINSLILFFQKIYLFFSRSNKNILLTPYFQSNFKHFLLRGYFELFVLY